MKLFIQVAFDLEDCNKPEYDSVDVSMHAIGLSHILYDADKKEIHLPANTFAGIRDCYSSHDEAIEHIRGEFALVANWKFCSGHVLITVSPASETTHDVHHFKPFSVSP